MLWGEGEAHAVALRDDGTYGLGGIQMLALDKGLHGIVSKLVSLWRGGPEGLVRAIAT